MKTSGASQGRSASETHLEKNRRTRGLAGGNPQQNAQAYQGSRPGGRLYSPAICRIALNLGIARRFAERCFPIDEKA
jgi:hypothetical protein